MVTLIKNDPVWTLDLGDDENRFSPAWLDAVEDALEEVATTDVPVALVTTGGGKFYSNGLDLDWLGAHPDEFASYVARVHELFVRVLTLPVPTVAAVNGHAFGAGAMLATAHDFRAMRTDRGFFCFPEVDIHIPFTTGMNALIISRFSPRTALTAMTTGRRYGGAEALAAGLVDADAPLEQLAEVAAGLVRDLAGKDRATLATIKARLNADVVAALRTPDV
ncbi:enoyl-CoA hydratase/isomerase family protein [Nocardioides sp. zg-536]|uniref:Enoyl-CoA hydratase/isomerase family protein n=1 Tax=Nocardioides faecalis TaxID=2803858 RepID=A0A939BW30_9ACTN|nr:enoyl-CoA hydratase/isomerase family protein [Nocardioides faecalis]MBM9460152.1 enoyl-CoA hydratase/isomerase family protein [Nocardioides faecalis]QVI60053.1 enoyl-CoA hydratase/isomerase family protein [Nocardioides faecalis]